MFRRIVYLLTNYDGRIRRRTFWLSLPLLVVVTLAVMLAGVIADLVIHRQIDPLLPAYSELDLATIIAIVLSWYFQMAVVVKRLHDRNKRARWLWLAQVPILGTIWLLVETGFLRGTSGPNNWGDDPRAGNDASPGAISQEAA